MIHCGEFDLTVKELTGLGKSPTETTSTAEQIDRADSIVTATTVTH